MKDDIVDRVSTFNMPPVVALIKVRYVESDIVERFINAFLAFEQATVLLAIESTLLRIVSLTTQ